LIIRFEDTLFHAEKVMDLITECLGKPLSHPYLYHLEASKEHGRPADFFSALAKYGRAEGRYDGLTPDEKKYVRTALNPTLMKTFQYPLFRSKD
jgi:hypothetical protein